MVFNHLSLPFVCKDDAESGVLLFFKVLKLCRSAGLKILLVDEDQDKSLMGLALANQYFMRDWYSTAKGDAYLKDWCRFLMSIETKQPLFELIDFEAIDNAVEVGFVNESAGARVLLAAFYFNTFLISFASSTRWRTPYIDAWMFKLDIHLEHQDISIPNLADEAGLQTHEEELKRRRNALLADAKDIWQHRNELFPNIVLLSNQIGSALQNWSARQDVLKKARDALNILELFCAKWKVGDYEDYKHKYLRDLGLTANVSGESSSVYKDPKKNKARLFWLDDGRQVYCENHIKLPDGYRMHFYPDAPKRRIYVVYLGPHLIL